MCRRGPPAGTMTITMMALLWPAEVAPEVGVMMASNGMVQSCPEVCLLFQPSITATLGAKCWKDVQLSVPCRSVIKASR